MSVQHGDGMQEEVWAAVMQVAYMHSGEMNAY
jgi:hypothetical protein